MHSLKPIEGSSLVGATSHDPESNTMRIQFKDGSVHEYAQVPAETHDALRAGGEIGSVGKYFHRAIKGQFDSTKIEERED